MHLNVAYLGWKSLRSFYMKSETARSIAQANIVVIDKQRFSSNSLEMQMRGAIEKRCILFNVN